MNQHGNSPEPLTRAECLELLATRALGRVAYSRRALPAITTVAYEVVGDTVVLRVEADSSDLPSLRDAVVAFQADHAGVDHRRGWSVSCVGQARPVTDQHQVALLEAAAGCAHGEYAFLRLDPDLLEGRVFHALPIAHDAAPLTAAAAPSS